MFRWTGQLRAVIVCVFLFTATAKVMGGDRIPAPLADLERAHKVKLIYLVPNDREPAPNYANKIRTVMTIVADLYREEARRRGGRGHELDFHFEDGQPEVVFHRSELRNADFDNTQLNSSKQWPIISKEVARVFGSPRDQLYVVFAETYGPGPAKFEWPGGIALGARYSANGGLGIFSAWILRDEFCATSVAEQIGMLADDSPIEGRTALGHGRINSPRYEFIEDGLGAVAHELGHALGLPHDLRNDDQYIMGNGFRNLRRNYLESEAEKPPVLFSDENAEILKWSRYLNPDTNDADNQSPDVFIEMSTVPRRGEERLVLRLKLSDNDQLGAVLFTFGQSDSVVGGVALEGESVVREFELNVPALQSGTMRVKARVADRAGNISVVTHQFIVK